MTSRITLAVALAIAAFAGLATPASARWEGNGQWQQDNRWHGNNNNNNNNRYYGNQYRAPPVVYATPYNYGYRAPPVIYNSTPGITVQIR